MATDEQLRLRVEEARRQAADDRRQAAVDAGHSAWMQMPVTGGEAKLRHIERFFTGKKCENGHVSPRLTLNLKCVACLEDRQPVGRLRIYPENTWAYRFERIAKLMEQSGKLYYLDRAGHIKRTERPITGDVRKACAKAARLTTERDFLHVVVPGPDGPRVRKYRR